MPDIWRDCYEIIIFFFLLVGHLVQELVLFHFFWDCVKLSHLGATGCDVGVDLTGMPFSVLLVLLAYLLWLLSGQGFITHVFLPILQPASTQEVAQFPTLHCPQLRGPILEQFVEFEALSGQQFLVDRCFGLRRAVLSLLIVVFVLLVGHEGNIIKELG